MNGTSAVQYPIRSELSVPASDSAKIAKGLASAADVVFLDLEDSVAPELKDTARTNVIRAMTDFEWGTKPRSYRINAVDTAYCYRDLIEVLVAAGRNVERVVVPKVSSRGDVAFIHRLLSQLEIGLNRPLRIQLELQIENPQGLLSVSDIANESDRITEISFGQGDFAASAGMPLAEIGIRDEWDQAVAGDRWMAPRQAIVFGAVANGRRPVNGPHGAYRDLDAFRGYCRMSRAIGFVGVWCIHPDQIAVANDVFTPTAAEIQRARNVIEAMETGREAGVGAVGRDGVMADEATVRMAQAILDLAHRLGIT